MGSRKRKEPREIVFGPDSDLKCVENLHFHTSFHFKEKPSEVYSVGGFLVSKNKDAAVSSYDFVYKIIAIGEDYEEDKTKKDRYYLLCQYFRDTRDTCVAEGGEPNELLCTSSLEEVNIKTKQWYQRRVREQSQSLNQASNPIQFNTAPIFKPITNSEEGSTASQQLYYYSLENNNETKQMGSRKRKEPREIVFGPDSDLKCVENLHFHTSFHFKEKPSEVYSVGGFLVSKNKDAAVSSYDFVYKIIAIGEDYEEDKTKKDRYYLLCQYFRDTRDTCVAEGGEPNELLCTSSLEEVNIKTVLNPVIVVENDEKKGTDHSFNFQYRYFSELSNELYTAPPSEKYDGWKEMYNSFKATFKSRFIVDHPSIPKFIPPLPVNNLPEHINHIQHEDKNSTPIEHTVTVKSENTTTSSQTSTPPSDSTLSNKDPTNTFFLPEVSGVGKRKKSKQTLDTQTSEKRTHNNNNGKNTHNNNNNNDSNNNNNNNINPLESILTPPQKKLCSSLPKIDNHKADKEQQEWLAWLEKEPSTSSVPPHIDGWFGVLLYRRGAERLVAAANTPPSFYLDPQ
eukprot:TRINITY_DN2425_c0_g1_i1.p1 TRINITY_DN2425_c0_g1~~TRINITY_DN2425_c0_g1_i1.p1  ORF type:complete len:566 (-),score=140.41 TRINITY_DN2425_c0_g1_i1:111-1808(-)